MIGRGIQDSESQEPPELPNEKKVWMTRSKECPQELLQRTQSHQLKKQDTRKQFLTPIRLIYLKRLFPATINGKTQIPKKVVENTLEDSREAAKQFFRVSTLQIVNRLKF